MKFLILVHVCTTKCWNAHPVFKFMSHWTLYHISAILENMIDFTLKVNENIRIVNECLDHSNFLTGSQLMDRQKWIDAILKTQKSVNEDMVITIHKIAFKIWWNIPRGHSR